MTEYTYGPWTPHTGDEFPGKLDVLYQVWLDGHTKEQAESTAIVRPFHRDWRQNNKAPIRFYRVCTPVEELWQVDTGWAEVRANDLNVRYGPDPHPDDTLRISWPYTVIDGKRVPDFTRKIEWEPLK